jgi:hypothetical protein
VALKSYHELLLQRPDHVAKLLSLLAPSSSPTEHTCRAVSELLIAADGIACLDLELEAAAIRALVLFIRQAPVRRLPATGYFLLIAAYPHPSAQTRRAFSMALVPVRKWGKAQCTQVQEEPNLELLDWVLDQLLEMLAAPPDDEGEMLVLVKSLRSLIPPSGTPLQGSPSSAWVVGLTFWELRQVATPGRSRG